MRHFDFDHLRQTESLTVQDKQCKARHGLCHPVHYNNRTSTHLQAVHLLSWTPGPSVVPPLNTGRSPVEAASNWVNISILAVAVTLISLPLLSVGCTHVLFRSQVVPSRYVQRAVLTSEGDPTVWTDIAPGFSVNGRHRQS